LAPYVTLYLVTVESLDAYTTVKAQVAAWVHEQTEAQLTTWQLLYVPLGSQPMHVYDRIFSSLQNDFYSNFPGDRTAMMFPNSGHSRASSGRGPGAGSVLGSVSATSAALTPRGAADDAVRDFGAQVRYTACLRM
jgi:hypothetical protein